MVSVCLLSNALSQRLPSYLGLSNLRHGVSTWLLQQSPAAAPYLGHGVCLHGRHSRPWKWVSLLCCSPLLATQLPVATPAPQLPLSAQPPCPLLVPILLLGFLLPWTWGSSTLLLAAPPLCSCCYLLLWAGIP